MSKYHYPQSRFVSAAGLQIHTRRTGQGPVLVLLHGLSSSLHTWEAWQQQLSERFTVVSLDLPGFGLTGPFADTDYSIGRYLRFLDACLDALDIEQCFLAGNSFGGLLAWQYALHAPQRVKKLIIVDASGYARDSIPPHYKLAMSPITRGLTYVLTPKSLIAKSVARVYGDASQVTDELVTRYHFMHTQPGNRQAYSRILRAVMPNMGEDAEKIKAITQPTLILWGEKDQIIPLAHAELFHRDIADSRLILYPGAGHIPMEECPQQSSRDVQQFLQHGDSHD